MKIVALGDTHGRLIWKEIVAKESESDKIIFIGDYFDTHYDVTGQQQLENFKDILEFKRSNPEKVILLIGNHDFHYIRGINETYSGYQAVFAHDFGEILEDAMKDNSLQMCYVSDNYVFTHAGITKTWCQTHGIDINLRGNELQEAVNELFKFKPLAFRFQIGDNWSQTGNDKTQPPIWVRPAALMADMLDDITCVVGHTTVKTLGLSDDYQTIILIDCIGTSGEYLVIENNIAKIAK